MSVTVQNVTQDSAQKLPKTQAILHVTWETDGRMQTGDFTIKRLTLGDYSQVAIRRAKLAGGVTESAIDEPTRLLNGILAILSVAIIEAPKWWKPEEFYDAEIVYAVNEEVMAFERTFRNAAEGTPSHNASRNSQAESPGA